MRLIYLAGPYTDPSAEVRKQRVNEYAKAVAFFLNSAPNLLLYSPILHHFHVANTHLLPMDFAFWAEKDFFMIKKASAMWILTLPGWEKSYGLSQELEYAIDTRKPIVYVISSATECVLTDERPSGHGGIG